MAFNPLQSLRKHRKTGLAALAIMCMFLFVMQGGFSGADALDRLASWAMGPTMRGEDVALINGQRVTQRDLAEVLARRQLANLYMKAVTAQVIQALHVEARINVDKDSKLPPGAGAMHGQASMNALSLQRYLQHPMAFFDPRFRGAERASFFDAELDNNPFTGAKLIDFLVWKDQARKLGINLTDESVNDELNRFLFNKLSKRISGPIEGALQSEPRFRGIPLADALRDELNVRLAKAALLGETYPQTPLRLHVPVSLTPDEFWAYFKDQRTELDISLLPVKVADFVPQVTSQPTEAELKKLYERWKERESSPDSKDPGFRQPRKIQVQWVGGSPDAAYYQQEAKKLAAVNEALTRFSSTVPTTPVLAGVLPPAINLATPLAIDLPLVARYFKDRFTLTSFGEMPLRGYDWSPNLRRPLRTQALYGPATIAAVIANAAGDRGVGAWPMWQGLGIAQEKAYRSELAVGLLFSPSPFAAAAIAMREMPTESILPYAVAKQWVQERYLEQLARDVLVHNLSTVRKDVEELRKNKKLDELDKTLAGLAEKLHLQTGKSGLRGLNQEPLADDPGVKPLRDAYLQLSADARAQLFRIADDPFAKMFSRTLFTPARVYEVETWPPSTPMAGDPDRDAWRSAAELFFIWKTQDQSDKILPFTDAKVRAEVEKAWRWLKARELAKKEAERIAKDAAPLKGDLAKLRDFALRNKVEIIEDLPRVAPFIKIEEQRPEFPLQYRLVIFPEGKVPNLGEAPSGHIGQPFMFFPGDEAYRRFTDQITTLRDQELGQAVTVNDQPEAAYYVAVSLKKHEPSREEFLRANKAATGAGDRRGELFRQCLIEKSRKFYQRFMETMRQEAKLEVNDYRLSSFDGDRRGDDPG